MSPLYRRQEGQSAPSTCKDSFLLTIDGCRLCIFGDNSHVVYLVVYIRPFGVYFASVVDSKGATPYATRILSEWIKQCGLVRFLYRSDLEVSLKEPAAKNLMRTFVDLWETNQPLPQRPRNWLSRNTATSVKASLTASQKVQYSSSRTKLVL